MATGSLSWSIYLLKQDRVGKFDEAFSPLGANSLELANLAGRFVSLPGTVRTPRWVPEIQRFLSNPDRVVLQSQSPAGLLAIERKGRTFVIAFGHGWMSLEDDWLEPDFGRRVALNLMADDGIVEVRTEQVFAKWHVASERAPRATNAEEFGLNLDRDLVAAVEVVPRNKEFGKSVRGATALRLMVPTGRAVQILDDAEALFKSNAYQTRWPEIDNLAPVKDLSRVSRLEALLDEALATASTRKNVTMFTPLFRRDEAPSVESYVYGRMSPSPPLRPYLTIENWVAHLESQELAPSIDAARATPIHLIDGSGDPTRPCNAFQCFGWEVGADGKQYILSSGVWYEATLDFVKRVNDAVARIETPSATLPAWNRKDREAAYNVSCCNSGRLLFDSKLLQFGGGKSRFEFCDFFDPKRKQMFFAKIISRSSGVSVLAEQVRRTVWPLFSIDGAYRR